MALFSESKLKKLRYPYNTARMVSLVKAIETSDAGGKYWSKTEAEEITAELSRETTPGSKASDFIQKRAALAFSRMSKRSPTLLTMKLNYGSDRLSRSASFSVPTCSALSVNGSSQPARRSISFHRSISLSSGGASSSTRRSSSWGS